MTLPMTGALSLTDIKSEFVGNTNSLNEYYSGGGKVPAGRVGVLGAIPSSGALTIGHFRGSYLQKNYNFTPNYSQCSYGTAYRNNGMPSDYDSNVEGAVIWTTTGGVGSYGWVGKRITPTTNTVTFKFACDDVFYLYVDGTLVLQGGDWRGWYTTTINVVPNAEIVISIYIGDPGNGQRGLAGNIVDTNGNIIAWTDLSWVSS